MYIYNENKYLLQIRHAPVSILVPILSLLEYHKTRNCSKMAQNTKTALLKNLRNVSYASLPCHGSIDLATEAYPSNGP